MLITRLKLFSDVKRIFEPRTILSFLSIEGARMGHICSAISGISFDFRRRPPQSIVAFLPCSDKAAFFSLLSRTEFVRSENCHNHDPLVIFLGCETDSPGT